MQKVHKYVPDLALISLYIDPMLCIDGSIVGGSEIAPRKEGINRRFRQVDVHENRPPSDS